MINTVRKGYKVERECEEILKRNGYKTYRAVRTKFNHIDIFGLFDVIAVSTTHVRLIQCKCNGISIDDKNNILNFKCPNSISKEAWIHEDREGFTKIIYFNNGQITERTGDNLEIQ